jgi:hypothetical protein
VIVEFHKFECQLFATTNDGLGYLVRNAVWQKMQELGDQIIAFLLAYLEVIGLVVDVVSAGSAGGFRRVAFQFIKEKMIDKATDEVLDAFHVDNQAARTLAGMAVNLGPKFKPKGDYADASVAGRRSTDSTALAGNPAADANKGLDLSRPKDHERSLAPPPKTDAPVVTGSTTQTPIVRFDKPAANDNLTVKKAVPDKKVDDLAARKAKIEEQKRLEAEKLAENLAQKQALLLMGERNVANAPNAGVVQMVRKNNGKGGNDPAVMGRGTGERLQGKPPARTVDEYVKGGGIIEELPPDPRLTSSASTREFHDSLDDLAKQYNDPLLKKLLATQGTERDQNFKDFIVPDLKKAMPPDSVFSSRNWADLERTFGLQQVPWKRGGGPDLVLIDLKSKKVAIVDLTRKPVKAHGMKTTDYADQLKKVLPPGWNIDTATDIYHSKGFSRDKILDQFMDTLFEYGYKPLK